MSKLPLSENSHFGWLYSFIRSFSRIICFSNIFCPHLEASRTCSFSTSFFASCLLRVSFLRLLLEQYLFWSCLNLDNVRICNKRLCWLTLKRLILQLDFYYANSPGKGCFFFYFREGDVCGMCWFKKKKIIIIIWFSVLHRKVFHVCVDIILWAAVSDFSTNCILNNQRKRWNIVLKNK